MVTRKKAVAKAKKLPATKKATSLQDLVKSPTSDSEPGLDKALKAMAKAKALTFKGVLLPITGKGDDREYVGFTVAKKAVYKKVSDSIAFSKGDGVHGAISMAAKHVSGFYHFTVDADGKVKVTFPTKGNWSMLHRLTGGAIKQPYHGAKMGYFGRDGQLTKDGKQWIIDRINGRGDYATNVTLVRAMVTAMTANKSSSVPVVSVLDENHKGVLSFNEKMTFSLDC